MSTTPRAAPSLRVLAAVLREARELLGRSPEQVAAVLGVSGRTIRRLEAGLSRPRYLTLETLASYYAIDAALLHQLVDWAALSDSELEAALRVLAGTEAGLILPDDAGESAEEIAIRLSRRGGGRLAAAQRGGGDPETLGLIEDFLALDRRRRTMARALVRELRLAHEREVSQR